MQNRGARARMSNTVKKKTSQNVWPRIDSNQLINQLINQNCAERGFFFENTTLVARRREHFRVFLVIFLVA